MLRSSQPSTVGLHGHTVKGTLINPALGIQHILADGRYQEYFCYGDQATVKVDIENCFHESFAFINDQQQELEGDFSILTAYDYETRELELKLIAYEAQEISATSLVAGYQKSDKAHEINRSVLLMMRSRAALLRQDIGMRRDLLKIDVAINKFASVAISLHLRIKCNIMAGIQNDVVAREEFYKILKGLLPWNTMRGQRRAELQRCRETRAGLEKRIGEAKARLWVLEQVRCGLKQEQTCVGMASR